MKSNPRFSKRFIEPADDVSTSVSGDYIAKVVRLSVCKGQESFRTTMSLDEARELALDLLIAANSVEGKRGK